MGSDIRCARAHLSQEEATLEENALRDNVTRYSPYVLVTVSAYLSIRQFIELNYGAEKVVILAITMFCIVWLLSETFELWQKAKGKLKYGYACMGLFLLCVEVFLGHYGWAWLFGGEGIFAEALHYTTSIGFSSLTVFGKYLYSKNVAVAPLEKESAAAHLIEESAKILKSV